MRTITYFTAILLFCLSNTAQAQQGELLQKIMADTDHESLQKLTEKLNIEETQNQKRVEAFLRNKKGPLYKTSKDGAIGKLSRVTADGFPLYYFTDNVNAAISTRTNYLNSATGMGLNLNGSGMTVHVWEVDPVDPLHQEYGSRVSISDGVTALGTASYHANHVVGTIAATGINASARGMANLASVKTYNAFNDFIEMNNAAGQGMLISNHSYGTPISELPVGGGWWCGGYLSNARTCDQIMNLAPYYLMVKSAGNDGFQSNSVPINGNSAYDKLTGTATSKNSLVVANADDAVIDSNGNLTSATISISSSQGPTDDLRIKPDITGNGVNVFSCSSTSTTSYTTLSGTSMSAPNVSGTLLLLQEYYARLHSTYMLAATLKGLVLHTADDQGISGPDAIWGWGVLNAKAAAEAINYGIIQENTLASGANYEITVDSDGMNPLVASISWNDPAGVAQTSGPAYPYTSAPVLVNDLDIRVINTSTTYTPYKMTSESTNGTGDNIVDPFERININGASGTYKIKVTHKGTLAAPQKYTLIVTGVPTCETNLTVTTNVLGGIIDKKQAITGIKANNSIANTGKGIYHAGSYVLLTDGFHARNGSTFRGYLEGCSNTFAGRPSPPMANTDADQSDEIDDTMRPQKGSLIYPNPNDGTFIVSNDAAEAKIEVYDLFQNLVFETHTKNGKETKIDISNNPKGIYVVHIISNNEVDTQKIIIR